MPDHLLTLIPLCNQIAVLTVLLPLSMRLIRKSDRAIHAVFLTFILSLWLLTDLYWVIYDFMRPDSRMPFAANEIGEAAIFLLDGAMLASLVCGWKGARIQTVSALAFAVCNVALWVAWSGEWVDDLFIGAAYAGFLYQVVRALTFHHALKPWEWVALGAGCALLILGQALTFFAPEGAKAGLDTGCSVLLALGPFFYHAAKLLAPSSLSEILGTVGFSMIRDAEIFVSPFTDFQVNGFLTLGNVSIPTLDGNKTGSLCICGDKKRVRLHLEALRFFLSEPQRFFSETSSTDLWCPTEQKMLQEEKDAE